ncbi:MAG: DUF5106 domain-containing protein [Lepagella sp.]
MKTKDIIIAMAMVSLPMTVTAQTADEMMVDSQIVISPLFEYPMAPDDMDGLQERSNYLMQHFWDKMDFKQKTAVDQNALNDAFRVYVAPMQFATAAEVNASVDKVITQISKNAVLSLQFAKAAEEALYGPRADVWNDEIYLKFIDNVLRCKQIKKERKARYEHVGKQLRGTLRGSMPPEFDYTEADGKVSHYHPNGVITVIEFGDPDCDDCRFSKLKMETNVRFSSLVERGKINVMFIVADPEEEWQEKVKDYPVLWHVGASESVSDLYDLRKSPSVYVIDREGKVAVKNVGIETAMQIATAAAEQ